MLLRHYAHAHHRVYDRNVELLAEVPDCLLPVSENDTAAGTDKRLFRFVYSFDYPSELAHVDLYLRLVSADGYSVRICKRLFQLSVLHIHRNVNEDRSFTSGRSYVESFLEHPRDVIRILDKIAVLDEGLRRASHVSLLEHIASQQVTRDLTGDRHDRNAVGISCRQSRNEVGSSRS